jgi:inositol-hexakisphosphate kinase
MPVSPLIAKLICTLGLCRYIGVLNVTFSKGPKPTKESPGEAHRIVDESKASTKDSDTVTHGKKSDELHEKKDQTHITENEQRIVSQSQQIGERPQVILEQNRHIVPFSLFDSAERPRSTEHRQSVDRRSSKSDPGEPDDSRSQAVIPSLDDPPPRPILPSPPSWGKTTVNSKFGEQILRDVFGPPPIPHHKKHAKGHGTLPRLSESSVRRSNITADPINESRRTGSIPADEGSIPAQANKPDSRQADNIREKALDIPTNIALQDAYLKSASALEDLSHGLEKIKPQAVSIPKDLRSALATTRSDDAIPEWASGEEESRSMTRAVAI